MTAPIGDNLNTLFHQVRELAYKRGHIAARLDLIKAIDKLDPQQKTATWAITEMLKHLDGTETPTPPKPETRGRKPKTK